MDSILAAMVSAIYLDNYLHMCTKRIYQSRQNERTKQCTLTRALDSWYPAHLRYLVYVIKHPTSRRDDWSPQDRRPKSESSFPHIHKIDQVRLRSTTQISLSWIMMLRVGRSGLTFKSLFWTFCSTARSSCDFSVATCAFAACRLALLA